MSLQNAKVAIIGGSLGGLAAGNVLTRLGARVTIFERQANTMENRGACLGFVDVDLWEVIRDKRMAWPDGRSVTRVPPPDGRQTFENQGSFYYGDMWSYLYSGLPEGSVKFGQVVETLGEDASAPTIGGETFDLAIIADGGWSSLRPRYFDESKPPEYTGYQIFWGRADVEDCGPDTLRSFDGRTELVGPYAVVTLPVPHFDGRRSYMCAWFVPTPEEEIARPRGGDNRQLEQVSGHGNAPVWFLPFVEALFGQHSQALRRKSPGTDGRNAADEIVQFARVAATKGKITASPVFEWGAKKTTVNRRVVLLGDAAHMASPMTAAGAHTGMQDALGLLKAFSSEKSIDAALRSYDRGAMQRSNALLRTSYACSRDLLPKQGKRAVKSPSTLLSQKHTNIASTPGFLRLI